MKNLFMYQKEEWIINHFSNYIVLLLLYSQTSTMDKLSWSLPSSLLGLKGKKWQEVDRVKQEGWLSFQFLFFWQHFEEVGVILHKCVSAPYDLAHISCSKREGSSLEMWKELVLISWHVCYFCLVLMAEVVWDVICVV